MGSQTFSAQYQQAPVPPGGALIKWHWFRTLRDAARTASPATRSSRAGIRRRRRVRPTTGPSARPGSCAARTYYLLDVLRAAARIPRPPAAYRRACAKTRANTVLIEDAGSGMHLIQDLQRDGTLRPIAIRPEGDKIVRMEAQTAVIEAGHVLLPEDAPWLGDFQVEIMAFPNGHHDDQVDSVAQFLAWAAGHNNWGEVTVWGSSRPQMRFD